MMPYVLNRQMLILAFFFAAMVIQRKDLYGLSYRQLEYFAWVQVLPLCMEFKIYGILKYVNEENFMHKNTFYYQILSVPIQV